MLWNRSVLSKRIRRRGPAERKNAMVLLDQNTLLIAEAVEELLAILGRNFDSCFVVLITSSSPPLRQHFNGLGAVG